MTFEELKKQLGTYEHRRTHTGGCGPVYTDEESYIAMILNEWIYTLRHNDPNEAYRSVLDALQTMDESSLRKLIHGFAKSGPPGIPGPSGNNNER